MILAAFLPQTCRQRLGLIRKVPRIEVFTIFVVTLLANFPAGTNIAYAVGIGVVIISMAYAWKSGQTFMVETSTNASGSVKYYDVTGPLFFTSANRFLKMMNP